MPDSLDIGKRRQSSLVAQTLYLVGRCGPREVEMFVPAFAGIAEGRKNISAMEYVPGPVRVEHALGRHRKCGKRVRVAGLVIPEQAALPQRDAADPAASTPEIFQHPLWGHGHLLAQPLCNDGYIDEFQQLVRVGTQATAVERGQNSGFPAKFGVVNCSVRLVSVNVQRAAAAEVQERKWVNVLIVAAANDRALAVLGHNER